MKIYSYTANTSSNIEDGVFGGYGIRALQESVVDNYGEAGPLHGGGLFGFGTTFIASHSLFTESISIVSDLPSELSLYNNRINNIVELNPITASGIPGITPEPQTQGGDYDGIAIGENEFKFI